MLSLPGITKKMNSFEFSYVFFLLVPLSFGRCDDVFFSICWMSRDGAVERQPSNLWLNGSSLAAVRISGKVTSVTVPSVVENKVTLQHGGAVKGWSFTITPRSTHTKVRGLQKPQKQASDSTKALLKLLNPSEVFACENGTLFFHQDENFFLASGYTRRLPLRLESRSTSMLLVSWVRSQPVRDRTWVTLFHREPGQYQTLSRDSTPRNHYRFTGLEACRAHLVCVEVPRTHSLTCISTVTDPDVPEDLEVVSYNTSSVSLTWACPDSRSYSMFLLTSFHLNGTDHVTQEVQSWLDKDRFSLVLEDLQPCTRIRFGLQTVCQAGTETRYSRMVQNHGNSDHSSIEDLHQTSFGPDNYTLGWGVRNWSSISGFRVHHEGALQGFTLTTSYTVGGLQPCQQYTATVEAVCGDGVLMSSSTITVNTGPHGVSELQYSSNTSTASWTPGTSPPSAVGFLYELSLKDGTPLQTSHLTHSQVHLSGLEEGRSYVLDVWEECGEHLESQPSQLCFQGSNSSLEQVLVRAAGTSTDLELQEVSRLGLTVLVPWTFSGDLQDDEPRNKMGAIVKDKLQDLLQGFDQPVRVELASLEPAADPDKMELLFMSFDATEKEDDALLPVEEQLEYLSSLKSSNFTVTDGVIHWDGPDVCASSKQTLCPLNSICINTLGSFTCTCPHGFYDVSAVMEPVGPVTSQPACYEKGLFSQCLDNLMVAGISRAYLTSYVGGPVDVKLNDGRCSPEQSDTMIYFHTSRKSSECGTERRVNNSHMEFLNTLTVTLTKEKTISRRDLQVVFKCVYPRHYVSKARINLDPDWLSSVSLLQFNSSLQLLLNMTLYSDPSFLDRYQDYVALGPDDTLFFQVSLQTNGTFTAGLKLQLDSCWATETPDPQDPVQGRFLQDGCPVDETFHWFSVNGLDHRTRFSIETFTMPKKLQLYFHCLTNVCGHQEDCTKVCSSQHQISRRDLDQVLMKTKKNPAAVVSAGPLVVDQEKKLLQDDDDDGLLVSIVCGSIVFVSISIFTVGATKSVMNYYEHLRLK